MKTTCRFLLGLASLALTACGLSEEELRQALEAAEPPPSSQLDFRVGQSWTESLTNKKTRRLLKYENGSYAYCDLGDFNTGSECPSEVVADTNVTTSETVNYVVAKVDAAPLALPGFAVRATTTTSKNWAYLDDVVESRSTELFTLGEHNGFVVKLVGDGDLDETMREALYPARPEIGGVYVDDKGAAWRVPEATTVDIGDLTDLQAHRIVKTTKLAKEGIDRDWLIRNCVLKTTLSDTDTRVRALNDSGEPCREPWLVEESIETVVHDDIRVKYTLRQRWLSLYTVGARIDGYVLVDHYETARGDDALVFGFHEEAITEEGEVIRLTR